MPKDLRFLWNEDLSYIDLDYDLNAGDLLSDEGLESAIIISLFTDRRANDDDTLPDLGSEDKRGWWADQVADIEGDLIGSRRWIYCERAKTTQNILNSVKKADEEALQWLIDDNIAALVTVTTERQGDPSNSVLAELIEIKRVDGRSVSYDYYSNWDSQINDNN